MRMNDNISCINKDVREVNKEFEGVYHENKLLGYTVMKRFDKTLVHKSGKKSPQCESCGEVRPQNIVVYDTLWSKIRKISGCNFLCQSCMEKALGRKLTLDDLKYYNESDENSLIMIPCNFKLCNILNKDRRLNLRYYTYKEFRYKKRNSLSSIDHIKKIYLNIYNKYLNEYENKKE